MISKSSSSALLEPRFYCVLSIAAVESCSNIAVQFDLLENSVQFDSLENRGLIYFTKEQRFNLI